MHIFSNLKVVGLILVLVIAGFLFLISNKPQKVTVAEPPPVMLEDTNSSSFMEEAERRREQMLEEKSAQQRNEKLLKQKENSVECQFWKQQKTVSSEAKVDEKIIEFCTLSSKGNNASAPDGASTAEASTEVNNSSESDSAATSSVTDTPAQ